MKKKIRILPVLLALALLFSFFFFPACVEEKKENFARVMVEQGAHFQVIGEGTKEVEIGKDVTFTIRIDEGYYYVSNSAGAEFHENQLTLRNVRSQKLIKIELRAYTYMVMLHEAVGLKVLEAGNYAQKSMVLEVEHGATAAFDIQIDEEYEYYQSVVNSVDGANESARYEGGRLCVENVRSDKEIFVHLRKKAVSGQEIVTVKLLENEAFIIRGDREQAVKNGSDVEFYIEVNEGYYYISNNCGAEYDAATGKIFFKEARADQEIELTFGKLNTGTSYYQNGVVESSIEEEGVRYLAKADAHYVFGGWRYTQDGKEVFYSYANPVTLSSEEAGALSITPTFTPIEGAKLLRYHANGGNVYGSDAETITDVFRHDVYLYPASLGEWCFKTFYRDGYAPLEYNTKADGSGTAFSLGSRIFLDETNVDLYVIWAKENEADEFEYSYVNEKTTGAGIRLNKYVGSGDRVVIPAYVEGIPVREIGGECFKNQNIHSVVLTKNLVKVENGAFANCTALETVYMCDSLEVISNECFENCGSLANLRMIAVLPPVYSDHLIGTTVRRFELLYNTRRDTRTNITFYAGSSTFQGLDGATLAAAFPQEEYRIVNCAQNAYVSGPLMMELYSHFLKEGDVMTFMPEYSPQLYSSRLELPSWIAVESFYDAFRYIDLRNYSNVFSSFYDLQHGAMLYAYVGKLQQLKDKQAKSYYAYDDTLDEYFTRGENFQIIEVQLNPEPEGPAFESFKSTIIQDINPLYDRCYKGKFTAYFAHFAFWDGAYAEGTPYAEYQQWLKENLAFSYISEYQNHMYALEYMSDSMSHLTKEGAILHSLVIEKELKAQMRKDGYKNLP